MFQRDVNMEHLHQNFNYQDLDFFQSEKWVFLTDCQKSWVYGRKSATFW